MRVDSEEMEAGVQTAEGTVCAKTQNEKEEQSISGIGNVLVPHFDNTDQCGNCRKFSGDISPMDRSIS
jgi:hypothetical protein